MDTFSPVVTEMPSGDVRLEVPGTDLVVVADSLGRALDEYADFMILMGRRAA